MKKTYLSKRFLILGATGFLGSRLKEYLDKKGLKVSGTSRNGNSSKLPYLNTNEIKSVESFKWSNFDVIIDCTGNIDYKNDPQTIRQNILSNVLGPLSIIKKLTSKQKYFYLSSHSVFVDYKNSNSYALSKRTFEEMAGKLDEGYAKVTILRLPALFSETRHSGLLFNIKDAYQKNKPLVIDFKSDKWHTMHLNRAIEILSEIVASDKYFEYINIGYPAESSIKKILNIAGQNFSGKYVKIRSLRTDHYVPDLKNQNKIIKISASDMETDLNQFLKSEKSTKAKDRVAAITFYKNKVLLMYRINNGKKYYTFPGGGIEKGETNNKALIREIGEETSIKVKPKKLLYEVDWDKGSKQYFYLCSYVKGTPKLGDFNEKEAMRDGTQYYEPKWYIIFRMKRMLLYPLEVRDLLISNLKSGVWKKKVNLSLSLSTCRQEI